MFHGSIVALVTPMTNDGEIDYQRLGELVEWHQSEGTDGIVILGTTGEASTIEPAERKNIIEQVVKQIKGHRPVIVGTGTNSTKSTVELSRQALELGADACLIVTPYYNRPTQEGLVLHFGMVAQNVSLPIIVYNVPSRTACDLKPETMAQLAHFPNIVALKEATGDIERVRECQRLNIKIDLLSGDDASANAFIEAGGKGVISVTANVAPKLMYQMCHAALQNERMKAREIDEQLRPLHEALFVEPNPIPAKWALTQMKKIEGYLRLPLTSLNPVRQEEVKTAMRLSGIL